MLRRKLFAGSFSLSPLAKDFSHRFCSTPANEKYKHEESILPDGIFQESAKSSTTRNEVLGKRWRCSGFEQKQANNNDSENNSTAPETQKSATKKKQNSAGFFGNSMIGSALNSVFRNLTRKDELEEEEQLKKHYLREQQQQQQQQNDKKIGSIQHQNHHHHHHHPDVEAIDLFSGVNFAVYERLDVSIRYVAPIEWNVNARVSENFVAIQCVPPPVVAELTSEEEFLEGGEQVFFKCGQEDEEAIADKNKNKNNSPNHTESKTENNNTSSSINNNKSAETKPSIHGLSISNFVYLSKVPPQVSASDLLKSFLTQFHRSVGRTSIVVGSSTFTEEQITNEISKLSSDMCKELVELSGFEVNNKNNNNGSDVDQEKMKKEQSQNNANSGSKKQNASLASSACAVCELIFKAPSTNCSSNSSSTSSLKNPSNTTGTPARALCKVFFHRSRRRHTVVVFAVPEDEWMVVKDLVKHSVVCVGELTHHNTGKIDY